MWSALNAEKFPKFPDLKSLLRYLQMCVHSVIIDHARRAGPPLISLDDLDPVQQRSILGRVDTARPGDNLQREEFWRVLAGRLKSDQERRVLHASFVLGLKPREISVRYPDEFSTVRDIYRTKENLLARLRRDAELAGLLLGDA